MASEKATRRASCTGKVRYESPTEAKTAAHRLRDQTHSRQYGFYKCRFCKGWHVGRRSKDLIRSALAHTTNKRKQEYFKYLLRRPNVCQ